MADPSQGAALRRLNVTAADERRRVQLVRDLAVMDDGRSQEQYDRIARLAKRLFDVDLVLITFVDSDRQWFKSHLGTDETEHARALTFCTHTIAQGATLVIPNAAQDPRFATNPWVVGAPHIRFYAGAPLLAHDSQAIGTICVADCRARQFSSEDRETLEDLAAMVMNQIRLDRGLTYIDAVTHLPNRVRFSLDLRDRMSAPRPERDWAVMIELMGLHEANDAARALGLPYFHDHLTHATQIIHAVLGETRVYHIGPTHLGFFAPPETDIVALLQTLRDRLRIPFVTRENIPARLQPGCGVRRLTQSEMSAAEVIRTLLLASSEARENGESIALYDPAADAAHQRSFLLLAEFPRALEKGELFLVYQPRIDASSGRCIAVEALLRWRHPIHGVVRPIEFLPLIAKTGLVREATHWVMHSAMKQVADWKARGIEVGCSFNISATDLGEEDFAERIAEAMSDSGIDAASLEIELVEDVSLLRDGASLDQLRSIHALGITIAIDDFGSGYSNLAYLLELPATVLKLDRSIIAGVLLKKSYATAVVSIITMAHQLGYSVVAEGIETVEIRDALRAWQCDGLQGYLFSRPLEAAQFEAWYEAQRQ